MANLTKELLETVKNSDGRTTKPYDATGTVTRVKDGIAYVHIAGGVDETPVKLTINAKTGDEVQVRVSGGNAWLVGNQTAPPTDNTMAQAALNYGKIANDAAVKATKDAMIASEAASSASASAKIAKDKADSVEGIARHAEEVAEGVEAIAERAETSAGEAKTAADTAFTNLSQVQSVLEVAEWIATHGTYTKATTFNPNATYYTVTATQVASPSDDDKDSQGVLIYYELSSGVYVRTTDTSVQSGKTYYTVTGTPVAGAKAEDIGQYYTLAVTDAMADYIQSHLALTDEGLWLIKDGSGYKLKLTNYGSYIVAPDGTTVVNQNTADGNIIRALDGTVIAHLGYGEGESASGTTAANPFYILGKPNNEDAIILEDLPAGVTAVRGAIYKSRATGYEYVALQNTYSRDVSDTSMFHKISARVGNWSTKEGVHTLAIGDSSHAEGGSDSMSGDTYYKLVAIGQFSHAEGNRCIALGDSSHAEGEQVNAIGGASHAEGGSTRAKGKFSHAEGLRAIATGDYSHAQNVNTDAGYEAQTVIGKNNDNQSENAFEIGNGIDGTHRSNAFAVDWDGEVKLALDTLAASGTDKEIYDALQDLGWDGDVVSSNILTIKELLLKILTEQPLLYDSYTIPSRTYNANSTTWLYALNYNIPEHVGYTPVGIVGVSPSSQSLLVCAPLINYRSYGRRIAGYIRNTGSVNLTDSIVLSLLYVKNERLDI